MSAVAHGDSPHSRAELEEAQSAALVGLLRAVVPANPFYTAKFAAAGVDVGSIRTPADLARVPFTDKAEFAADQKQRPPYGTNLTFPVERYTRVHQTSGTGDVPLRWLDTRETWDWHIDCWRAIYEAAGLRAPERIFFPFSFGPFLGFWAAFEAAQRFGHLVMAGGSMSSVARLRFLLDHRATVVLCTPTYALRLADTAEQEKMDLAGSAVRALIVAGEPGGSIPAVRERIEKAWGARVFDHTGMTEVGPSGYECVPCPGAVHILESKFIVEVIDRETLKPAAPGAPGELVLTNLGRVGSPAIRYRTGDMVRWTTQPCACGRADGRMLGGIIGRADDMLLIRGNNLYPGALEAVVRRFPEVAEYRVKIGSSGALTRVNLELEPAAGVEPDGLAARVGKAVADSLCFKVEVSTVSAGTLPRFEMKAKRFVRV
jgi:phenylacetate-CoA ligase